MPCPDGRPAGSRDGFTLIETLAAIAILALALASLLGTFSNGLRVVRTTGNYVQALILAQSLMAERTSGWKQKPGKSKGANGALAWTVRVDRAEPLGAASLDQAGWRLYRISVEVSWDRDRQIRLETLKLGERDDRI